MCGGGEGKKKSLVEREKGVESVKRERLSDGELREQGGLVGLLPSRLSVRLSVCSLFLSGEDLLGSLKIKKKKIQPGTR